MIRIYIRFYFFKDVTFCRSLAVVMTVGIVAVSFEPSGSLCSCLCCGGPAGIAAFAVSLTGEGCAVVWIV